MCLLVDLIIKRALFLGIFYITYVKNSVNGLSASPINREPIPIPIGQTASCILRKEIL